MIALDAGFPVGAAWYPSRPTPPAYGYVDDQTPELTIAVVPSKRGKGLGEELMQSLLDRARQAGHRSISLSVERANPARKLYERFGFPRGRRAGRHRGHGGRNRRRRRERLGLSASIGIGPTEIDRGDLRHGR